MIDGGGRARLAQDGLSAALIACTTVGLDYLITPNELGVASPLPRKIRFSPSPYWAVALVSSSWPPGGLSTSSLPA